MATKKGWKPGPAGKTFEKLVKKIRANPFVRYCPNCGGTDFCVISYARQTWRSETDYWSSPEILGPVDAESDYAPYRCLLCDGRFETLLTRKPRRKDEQVSVPIYRGLGGNMRESSDQDTEGE